jgi:hypothetical protein
MQCGRDYGLLVELEDPSRSLQSVNFGHHEIHDNDVRMKAGGQRHRGLPFSASPQTFHPEQFRECCAEEFSPQVIIRDKNS